MLKFIDKIYAKKISSKGLSIFRIFFALNFFFEINRIYRYRQLYFDPIPFIEKSSLDYSIPLIIWMGVLILLILGLFTRFASILNYIFAVIFISSMNAFEYHMDYTYTGISFLMMLIPLSNSFSLDNLLKKYKYSTTKSIYKPIETVPVLYYYLLILVGIGFVYFDSIFFKYTNDVWLNGLGMWLPASLPQFTILQDQWLLNQKYIIIFLGYFTVFFETIFIFTFFIKRTRVLFLIIGVSLHIGIFLEFPIPYFALGVIAIYLLMVPVKYWSLLFNLLKNKTPSLVFYYDTECPLCVYTKITIKHFDVFNKVDFKSVQQNFNIIEFNGITEDELLNNVYSIDKYGVVSSGINTYKKISLLLPIFYPFAMFFYLPVFSLIAKKTYNYIALNRSVERCTEETCGYIPLAIKRNIDEIIILNNISVIKIKIVGFKVLLISLIFLQIYSSFDFPAIKEITRKASMVTKITEMSYRKIQDQNINLEEFSVDFLGLTEHGVFADYHLKKYNKIFTVSYNGKLLPIFDEFGMPDEYLVGGVWVNYLFRVNKPNISSTDKNKLVDGLVRYTAFWAHKNKIDLKSTKFEILMKDIKTPFKWEKNLLLNNRRKPWVNVGELNWKNKEAKVRLKQIHEF